VNVADHCARPYTLWCSRSEATSEEAGAMTATTTDADLASRRSLVRSTAVVGAALMAGNLASYLLAIIGSHRLGPSDYGLFGAMLAILLIGGIPALALQAVVARRTAAEQLPLPRAIRDGVLTGLVSVAVGLVAWPGLTPFLHVGHHGLALVFAVAGLLPLTVLGAVQGHLQGTERFNRLAAVVVVIGVGRLLGGVIPLLLGAEATGIMAGVAIATAISAVVALRVVATSGSVHVRSVGPTSKAVSARPELVTATLSMGALLLLSSLDLLLARHVLPASETGRYAAGNVVTKAAFWLPQAVPLTALPRLSRIDHRAKALRDAAMFTAVIAAASITVTALAGVFLLKLTFGAGYGSIGGVAWLFALQGSALAGVQLLVFHDIAARRRGVVPLVLIAAAIETTIILAVHPHSPRPIIAIAASVAVSLVVVTALRHWRSVARERPPARDQWAASSQLRPTPTETSSETSRA
jgi:O-antigen/teichoic acid export membrane protein